MTVVAGVVTTGFAMTGLVGIPVAFLAIGAVLMLFSVGYVAMSRYVTNAGAFYAYIARGIGKPFGVGAAWIRSEERRVGKEGRDRWVPGDEKKEKARQREQCNHGTK